MRREESLWGKVKRFISNLILVICILVFLWSAFQLYLIYDGYKKGDEANANIQTQALYVPEIDTDMYWKYYVDFEELKMQNADTVAWVRFDEPEIINYPIVSSQDNEDYLTKTFTGGQSIFGTIFTDMRNTGDFKERHTILYGHNMKNASMFGSLKKFKDKEYFAENPYFYIYTPDGMAAKYQIVSVKEVPYDSWYYQTQFISVDDFTEYCDKMQNGSMHQTDVEIPVSGNIVTLSTCTASDVRRLVVQGLRIEERPMEKVTPMNE